MKAILCPSLAQPNALAAARQVANVLARNGVSTVFCTLYEGEEIPAPESSAWSTVENEMASSDVLVVFGGDGALLRAARLVADAELPVASVNLGHLGFITDLGPGDTGEFRRLAARDYAVSERMMLKAKVIRNGECILEDVVLNDVEIKGRERVIALEISGDDAVMLKYTGDGAVVATPTGSTAYSMSAGGPIVEPDTEAIIVTPICPHMLAARSFVLDPSRTVRIRMSGERKNPAVISCDGNDGVSLLPGDVIEIRRSEKKTRLIRFSERSFYSTVYEKLGDR
ncbi:MAG: NAD(+)/NADH kinase [Oscillospiraceae bacterium]|nr:NAD(+)/NADH kinase [Oscillospiraceae bacterium]